MNPLPKRTALRSLLALPLAALGFASTSRSVAAAGRAPRADLEGLAARQARTEAREQITEVLHRYARGWDREDEAAIRDCFWPESTHQHGAFKGLSQDFVAASYKATRHVKLMSHMITNVSIEVDGARALAESYFFALHRRPSKTGPGNVDWILKGRYLDRFERRGDTWKIVHRRGLHDFSRTFDPADTSLDAAPAEQLSGNRATDPYYAMLAELRAGR
jgi:SnoaL-like domain